MTVVLCLRVGYILYDSYQEKQEQIIAAEESEVSDRIADYYEQQALEVFDAIPLGEL